MLLLRVINFNGTAVDFIVIRAREHKMFACSTLDAMFLKMLRMFSTVEKRFLNMIHELFGWVRKWVERRRVRELDRVNCCWLGLLNLMHFTWVIINILQADQSISYSEFWFWKLYGISELTIVFFVLLSSTSCARLQISFKIIHTWSRLKQTPKESHDKVKYLRQLLLRLISDILQCLPKRSASYPKSWIIMDFTRT